MKKGVFAFAFKCGIAYLHIILFLDMVWGKKVFDAILVVFFVDIALLILFLLSRLQNKKTEKSQNADNHNVRLFSIKGVIALFPLVIGYLLSVMEVGFGVQVIGLLLVCWITYILLKFTKEK